MKSIVKVVFLALLLFMTTGTIAYAADPTPADSGGFFENLAAVSKQVSNKVLAAAKKDLKAAGTKIAEDQMKGPALEIAGGLALLYLFYEVLQFLGGKRSSILSVLFDVAIPAAFAAMLIKGYSENINSFETLLDVFRSVGGDGVGAIMDTYGTVLKFAGDAIIATLRHIKDLISVTNLGNFGALISAVLDGIITGLFALLMLVFIILGFAEIIGLILMGPFLFAVALAFGPVFIAGIVTPWTREYFKTWVQFLVASAVLTGVVNVILLLAKAVFEALSITAYTADSPVAISMIVATIMLMAVNSLIGQAPSIANSLVPGHLGITGGSSSEAKRAVSTAMKWGSGVGKAAVAVGKTPGRIVGSVKSAMAKSSKPAPPPTEPPLPKINLK